MKFGAIPEELLIQTVLEVTKNPALSGWENFQ